MAIVIPDQIILPNIPTADGGYIELRLNLNGSDVYDFEDPLRDPDLVGPLRITWPVIILDSTEIKLEQSLSDTEGLIQAEEIETDLYSPNIFKGRLYNTATDDFDAEIEYDLQPDLSNFVDAYLVNEERPLLILPSALIPIWATKYKADNTSEIFFAGHINRRTGITKTYTHIHNEQTDTEEWLGTAKIRARGLLERLKERTFGGMKQLFDSSDAVTTDPKPFFNGFVEQPDNDVLEEYLSHSALATRFKISDILDNASDWDNFFEVAFYGHFDSPNVYGSPEDYSAFPNGTWGIKLTRILARLAEICGFDFDESADMESAFEWLRMKYNSTTNKFFGVITDPKDFAICYQYFFGQSPYDLSAIDTPIRFADEANLSSLLQAFAYFLGCHVWPEIDQATGKARVRLLSRRKEGIELPSNWILLDDNKEDSIELSKDAIEMKVKASTGMIVCPNNGGTDRLSIESPFRIKAPGYLDSTPSFDFPFMVFDTKKPYKEQYKAFKRSNDGEEDKLEKDGWVLGAYLYYYDSNTASEYYPDNVTPDPLTTWEGYYPITHCTEKTGVYDKRDNMLYGPAQFYARELLGDRRVISRDYFGTADDTGSIRNVGPNMFVNDWLIGGKVRDFRAKKITRLMRRNTSSVKFVEKPDYDTLEDLSAKFVDGTNATSGGGGTATGGGVSNSYNTIVVGGPGFRIPYKASVTNAQILFWLVQLGATLGTARFEIDNATSGANALQVKTNGTGAAIQAEASDTAGLALRVLGSSGSAAGIEIITQDGLGLSVSPGNGRGFYVNRDSGSATESLTKIFGGTSEIQPALEVLQGSTTAPGILLDGSLREGTIVVPSATLPGTAYSMTIRDKYVLVDVPAGFGLPINITLPNAVDCIGATYYVWDFLGAVILAVGAVINVLKQPADAFHLAGAKTITVPGAGLACTAGYHAPTTTAIWIVQALVGV